MQVKTRLVPIRGADSAGPAAVVAPPRPGRTGQVPDGQVRGDGGALAAQGAAAGDRPLPFAGGRVAKFCPSTRILHASARFGPRDRAWDPQANCKRGNIRAHLDVY